MGKNTLYFMFFALIVAVFTHACATAPEKEKKREPVKLEPREVKPVEVKPEEVRPEEVSPEEVPPEIVEPEKIEPEGVTPEKVEIKPVERKKIVIRKSEETESLDLFTEILELTESTDDRASVLPEIEGLYAKIIYEYPDAPLAQESYWKIITIYVDDYSPPAYDKAEMKYSEFLEKYPQSFYKGFIEDTLGNSYYKNAEWNRLLNLSAPAYWEYINGGKQPSASMLFMYSEAHYNLGNIKEAGEGYKIVAELFPKLIIGIKSREMLEAIKEAGN